jgi:DNA-binding winged helix-turn-helix (wHTH) protein
VDLHLPRAGQNEFWAVLHQLYPWCRLMAMWAAGLEAAVLETALAAGAAWVGGWDEPPERLCQRALAAAHGDPPAQAGQPAAVLQAYACWAQSQPRAGALHLEPKRRAAVIAGREYHLSHLHYCLLEQLYRHNGRVVATTELLRAGWPYAAPDLASLAQLKSAIHRLRQILEPNPHQPRYVLTAPGGYALCATGLPPTEPLP